MLGGWLDQHTSRSPAALGARVRAYALAVAPTAAPAGPLAETLVGGARDALTHVLAQPGGRSVALDLLAADALITLALLAQAEDAPGQLGEFARTLLRSERLLP